MKILSFDVGIKNLAYCILEKNDKIRICDWGIINVSCDEICHHCSKSKSTSKQCDRSACFKNSNGFCVCSGHSKLKIYKDMKWSKISKRKNGTLQLGDKMVKELDKMSEMLHVDTVIIENQPALKNPIMKTVQMMLYSYFLINGYTSDISSIKNMEMINARNKLKVYKGPNIECPYPDTKVNRYKRNKFFAIKYCEKMITDEDIKFVDLYTNSKKKDDLSDCYLQGIYWLTK